jgi:hypothetical protein
VGNGDAAGVTAAVVGASAAGRAEKFISLRIGHLGACLQLGTWTACSAGNNVTNMNKITFILSLVSLSLTVASASAAQNNNSNEIVQLPAFRVEASRFTPAERKIEDSLAELRQQGAKSLGIQVSASIDPNGDVAKAKVEAPKVDAQTLAKALSLRPAGRS